MVRLSYKKDAKSYDGPAAKILLDFPLLENLLTGKVSWMQGCLLTYAITLSKL